MSSDSEPKTEEMMAEALALMGAALSSKTKEAARLRDELDVTRNALIEESAHHNETIRSRADEIRKREQVERRLALAEDAQERAEQELAQERDAHEATKAALANAVPAEEKSGNPFYLHFNLKGDNAPTKGETMPLPDVAEAPFSSVLPAAGAEKPTL